MLHTDQSLLARYLCRQMFLNRLDLTWRERRFGLLKWKIYEFQPNEILSDF